MKTPVSSPYKFKSARACAGIAAVAAMLLATTANAWAFSCTWGGAVDSSASNPANWRSCAAPGGVPGTGDDVFFPDNADSRAYHHDFAVLPTFRDVAFESGYTVSGGAFKWSGSAIVSVPFTATADFDGSASFNNMEILDATSGLPGRAYFLGQLGTSGGIYVGNGSMNVPVTMTSSQGNGSAIVVTHGGRLSMASGFQAYSVTVKGGGALAISDKVPGVVAPGVLGSGTIASALSIDGDSALEYRAYPPGNYDPGHATVGGLVALQGSHLTVMLDDPAQPQPEGAAVPLIQYTAGQLTGQFNNLPEGTTFAASNAPGVHYRISYGTAADPRITLTRVAAPVNPLPGPGGVAAVPTLGHVGLALLSACMAGVGALRRRAKGRTRE